MRWKKLRILITFVGLAWLLLGWLQVWHSPPIPLEVKEVKAVALAFETGAVAIDDSLSWTTITLSNTYSTAPVIIATPVTTANCPGTCSGTSAGNGGMYPIPLVRNVTTTSFDISMCIDGGSVSCSTGMSTETFHWFAFDVDDAGNYDWIEVGTTASVVTNGSDTNETYSTSFIGTPDVWTQAQTYSQGGEIGATAWVDDNGKTTSGFTYVGCVHTDVANSCDTNNPVETFGYVAIDVANENFDSGVNFQSGMADISHSAWTVASFSPSYTNPRVMVTQNDDDGGQDPEYAWARNVISSGMDFRYCEEDAGTVCNTHTSEKTYWFAVEEPSVVVSVSVSDGVVSYGQVALSGEQDTTITGVNDTQTATNDGNVTESFNIKTSHATTGTQWSVGAAVGSDIFVHSFSVNGGGGWEILNTYDTYETLTTGVTASSSQDFDLKIGIPSFSTDYQQKTITVTIQAVQQ